MGHGPGWGNGLEDTGLKGIKETEFTGPGGQLGAGGDGEGVSKYQFLDWETVCRMGRRDANNTETKRFGIIELRQ